MGRNGERIENELYKEEVDIIKDKQESIRKKENMENEQDKGWMRRKEERETTLSSKRER
jgi:hypothetical protein